MEKTVTKNIIVRDSGEFRYKVEICRDRKIVIESFKTLEEAIIARDEIIATYNSQQVLAHSRIYADCHLLKACQRFRNEKVLKIDRRYVAQCSCSRCGKTMTFLEVKRYDCFIRRNRLCASCYQSEHIIILTNKVKTKDIPFCTNLTTGIKNVYFDTDSNAYRVSIVRDGQRRSMRAKTLKTAIQLKNQMLSYYHNNGALPTARELRF